MIKDLLLPDLGEGIEGAEVSEVSVSVGDKVRFCSIKPMSKTKNCSLTGVLRKSET